MVGRLQLMGRTSRMTGWVCQLLFLFSGAQGFGLEQDMTERELKRLGRTELLRLLVAQMKKNAELEAQLAEARETLRQREITASKCGSLAEAALALNRMFEQADQVVADYVANAKRMCDEIIPPKK